MSEERQMFSVAELVEAVGAPRTTINDWLTRYAKYIDYEMRGKRKVYSLSSVQVLRFIPRSHGDFRGMRAFCLQSSQGRFSEPSADF